MKVFLKRKAFLFLLNFFASSSVQLIGGIKMTISEFLKAFWPLLVLYSILLVWALQDAVKRKETSYLPKWVWVLIILFVGTFGPLAYLAFGRRENGY
jgi:hypothetical protein